MNKFLPIILVVISSPVFSSELCKYAFNSVNPEISVSMIRNNDGTYEYKYSVLNESTSRLPISWLLLETNSLHRDGKFPSGWGVMNWGGAEGNFLKVAAQEYKKGNIEIGKSLDGFKFSSSKKPGFVKFRVQGENYTPISYQQVAYDSVKGLCPGHYQSGSTIPGVDSIEGITMGPVPEHRFSFEARIKRPGDSNWLGHYLAPDSELLSFSPMEKGKVEVALLNNDEVNLEDINVSTIEFGRGKAKPSKASIAECQLSPKVSSKALIMTFDLYDINVLCNADHALFLTAKTKDGKDVFGGVKIRPTECTQENWKREADKMIDAEELDLPKGKYKTKG